MQNKKAIGGLAVFLMIVGVLPVAGAGIYFAGVFQNIGGTVNNVIPSACGDSTGILTVNAYNKLNPGTNITPTLSVGVDGSPVTQTATSGTTTFGIGKKLIVYGALADYIDTSVTGTMECGGLRIDMPMYYSTSDNPTIRVKNDDGDFVTDDVAGSTVNQTNLATGETLIMDIEFAGTALESSGDGVYVIEFPASTNANITKIELSGASSVPLPQVHSLQNAASKYAAFKIPAVVGSEKAIHTLTVTLGATKDLAGGVYTDWYSEQSFVNDDGTIGVGVEDSDGSSKYENTLDFDFYINAA
jgi:hypothetical protein